MRRRVKVKDREFKLYLEEQVLLAEIKRLAGEIKSDLKEEDDPLFVCILNGAFMFAVELARELDDRYEITFAKYSSYQGMSSGGELREDMPPQVEVKGRKVIIIEDLIDSGLTLSRVKALYQERGATEVRVAVLFSKPDVPKVVEIRPDYVGLEIANDFIVGHGLDYDGEGRMYRDVYVVCEES